MRLKYYWFLSVILSVAVLFGCKEDSSVELPLDPVVTHKILPSYIFDSRALAQVDSLFWKYELEAAEALLQKVIPEELSAKEQAIRLHRLAYFAALAKSTELTDSLLQLSPLDSIDHFWNIDLGWELANGLMNDRNRVASPWLKHHIAANDIAKNQKSVQALWLAEINSRIGRAHLWGYDDAFEARDWFARSESILYQYPSGYSQKVSAHYNQVICERQRGDYESALRHAIKAKELLESKENSSERMQVLVSMEIAINYNRLLDTSRFVNYYDQTIQLLEKYPSQKRIQFSVLDNYGRLCLGMNLIDKAEHILVDLEKATSPKDTFQQMRLLEFKSSLMQEKNKKAEALAAQFEALDLHKVYSGFDAEHQSFLLTNLGAVYQEFGDHAKAIESFVASLEFVLGKPFDFLIIPEVEASSNYLLHGGYGYEFAPIARSLRLAKEPISDQYSNIEVAQKYYDYLLNIFDKISKDQGEGMMLRDLSDFQEIFGEAIDCSVKYAEYTKTDQADKIFNFMERGKAVLLYQSIYLRSLAEQLGIPSDLYETLQKSNEEKMRLEDALKYASGQSQKEINQQLTDNDKELLVLKQKIDSANPKFFEQLAVSKLYALKDVKQWARRNNKAVIQYHWSPTGLFGLAIWPDGQVRVKQIEKATQLQKTAADFIRSLNTPPKYDTSEFTEYKHNAAQLGSALLSDLIPAKAITDQLVIIPDGFVAGLPFETLTLDASNSFDFYKFNYLLNQYTISYHYSSSTLLHASSQSFSKLDRLGLFAFSDNNDKQLLSKAFPELPGSSEEVDAIQSLVEENAQIWKGKNATRENFEKNAASYDVIHLAMHAEASSDDRFANRIVFRTQQDTVMEFLYAHELVGLNLNADLVFLSACNTGKGVQKAGEGIYSMSRGFVSAGVPTIILSQWELEDQVAPEIILPFYRQLQDGKSIDESLRIAKLDFIKSKDERRSHPHYWSALIAIGKTDPIYGTSSWWR